MSRILDTRSHGYMMLFRDAVKSTERALRKRWGRKCEVPLMSHALSQIDDNGRWHVADIAGQPVAIVDSSGRATLIDDLECTPTSLLTQEET